MENTTDQPYVNSSLPLNSENLQNIMNILLIPSSLFIVTILTIDIIVLNKCKRIPFQVKWLSNSFIISSFLSDLNIIVMSTMYLTMDPVYSNVIAYIRVIISSSFSNMGWGSSALLAMERILALSLPLRYSALVNKSRLVVLTILSCTLTFVIPCAGSLWIMFNRCGPYMEDCNMFDVMFPTRIYFTTTVGTFLIFNVVAYVTISKILRRHLIQIGIQMNSADNSVHQSKSEKIAKLKENRAKKKLMNLTQTISSVILIFVSLHFLPILHSLSYDVLPGMRTRTWQTIFRSLSYLAAFFNALMCSYMYIWRIQECKMMFLKTFLWWNKKCCDEAERIRLSVYDIVTIDKRSLSVC